MTDYSTIGLLGLIGNGVYVCAIWENTALVQRVRCEPLGEHLIHWTSAVFSHIA